MTYLVSTFTEQNKKRICLSLMHGITFRTLTSTYEFGSIKNEEPLPFNIFSSHYFDLLSCNIKNKSIIYIYIYIYYIYIYIYIYKRHSLY